MTPEIAFVLLVGFLTVVLFVTEKLRVDVVALLVMVTFIGSGVLTPTQGIAGFSNPATVTVAAMFVLAAALRHTEALDSLADLILRLSGESLWRAATVLMVTISIISAFINNTAAVAVFLPVAMEVSRRAKLSPSKLLIPLSFASLFGGVCTLIGTSTNILVSTLAVQHGEEPVGMFEMAPLGLLLALVGISYMLLVGIRLLPARGKPHSLEMAYDGGPYLTEVTITEEYPAVGRRLLEVPLVAEKDLEILEIQRGQERIRHPDSHTVLQTGDLLRIRCCLHTLSSLRTTTGVRLHPLKEEQARPSFLEAVVAPGSSLTGHTLKSINFRDRFGCTAVALRRRGQTQSTKLGTARLRGGDVLLVAEAREGHSRIRASRDFVLVSRVEMSHSRRHLAVPSAMILAVVVGLVAFDVVPVVVASLMGCAALILAGSITPDEVYEAIDWSVIMLLGGMLTLGAAVEESGADKLLAQGLLSVAGDHGPWFLLSMFYLVTSLLTEGLSNNATAVLLVPIAFSASDALGVDSRPFLMAITFAASASFMTPVGYQTNTLVYGPGQYRFSDYLKVGTPLNLLFWLIATFLIPVFWPFQAS